MSRFPNVPTGHVRTTPTGRQLVIERTFAAPIEDVWASLTEPDRLARWYGIIAGELGEGRTFTVALTAEEGADAEPARILECDPPSGFVIETDVGGTVWHLSVELVESEGATTMTFIHSLADGLDVSDIGPGWEFYADRLTASRDGSEMPDWEADGYLTALAPHYRDQ